MRRKAGTVVAALLLVGFCASALVAGQPRRSTLPLGEFGVLIYEGHPPDSEHYADLLRLLFDQWPGVELPPTRIYAVGFASHEENVERILGRNYATRMRTQRMIIYGFVNPKAFVDGRLEVHCYRSVLNDRLVIHEALHFILAHAATVDAGLNQEDTVRKLTEAFTTSAAYKGFLRGR